MEHALGEAARYATLCSSLSVSGTATTCAVHTGTEVKALVGTAIGRRWRASSVRVLPAAS